MTTTTVAPPELGTTVHKRRTAGERASIVGTKYGLVGIWALLIVFFGALRPDTFLTLGNFQSLFDSQSLLMFLSLGLVISLVSGDFNLALPGVVPGTSGAVTANEIHIPTRTRVNTILRTDDVIHRNDAYAKGFAKGNLPRSPARKLAVSLRSA